MTRASRGVVGGRCLTSALILVVLGFFAGEVVGQCWQCTNPYDVLGVRRNADKAQVKKAFRKLSLTWHPDKNPSPEAAVKFMKISKAFSSINDGTYAEHTIDSEEWPSDYSFMEELANYFGVDATTFGMPNDDWRSWLLELDQWVGIVAFLVSMAFARWLFPWVKNGSIIFLFIPMGIELLLPTLLWILDDVLNMPVNPNKQAAPANHSTTHYWI